MLIISVDPCSLSWRKEAGFPNPLWKVRELVTKSELQLSPAHPVLSFCRGCDCGQCVFPLPAQHPHLLNGNAGFFFFPWHQICALFSRTASSALWHLSCNPGQFWRWLPGARVRLTGYRLSPKTPSLCKQWGPRLCATSLGYNVRVSHSSPPWV